MGVFLVFAVPTVCFAALLIAWLICDKKPEYKEGTYERIKYPKAMVNFCEVMNNWLAPFSIVFGAILLLVTISLGIAAGCCAGLKERKDAEFQLDYISTIGLISDDLKNNNGELSFEKIQNIYVSDENEHTLYIYFSESEQDITNKKAEDSYLTIKDGDDKDVGAIYMYLKTIKSMNERILYSRKHHDSFWTGWYNTCNYYRYKTILFV